MFKLRLLCCVIVLISFQKIATAQAPAWPITVFAHEQVVAGASWSDDGTQLLTWSHDQTIQLWNMETHEPEITLQTQGWVEGAVWQDDRLLAWSNAPLACQVDCLYHVLYWQHLEVPPIILSHPTRIHQAIFADSQIITAAEDGQIRVWENNEIQQTFRHQSAAFGVRWHENEILSWSADGTARRWDLTGQEIARFAHTSWVNGATWNQDYSQILTWSRDYSAVVWDVTTGEQLWTLQHEGWVSSAIWNTTETQILTTSTDGTIRIWENGELLLKIQHHGPIFGGRWTDSQVLAWSNIRTGWVGIWDTHTGELLTSMVHRGFVSGALWHESRILTWSDDGFARLWIIPNENDCIIITTLERVNQRENPSTNSQVKGTLTKENAAIAINQITGGDGFVWWQLSDNSWVRGDVVDSIGMCDNLAD